MSCQWPPGPRRGMTLGCVEEMEDTDEKKKEMEDRQIKNKAVNKNEDEVVEEDFILISREDKSPEDVSQHNRHPIFPGDALQDVSKNHLSEIDDFVDELRATLWPLNKFIHENPELAFKEYKAHDALTTFMRSQKNWNVTPSVYGMETAWVAVYDSGRTGPAVSFNVEMGRNSLAQHE